ncbi:hypothetical protein WICMUC_001882 [Wickerhamomyces mucosus]|uniref:Uncharacterized protein n=1 Tax=Wickerhamomyces mucosus TaxID=1378264 RepID=A0A9P8PT50_9ASCO|nr:hypothetical protein WICMUC_001882 [Wickerhamomyces mucosus]
MPKCLLWLFQIPTRFPKYNDGFLTVDQARMLRYSTQQRQHLNLSIGSLSNVMLFAAPIQNNGYQTNIFANEDVGSLNVFLTVVSHMTYRTKDKGSNLSNPIENNRATSVLSFASTMIGGSKVSIMVQNPTSSVIQ